MRKVAILYDFENAMDEMVETDSNLETSITTQPRHRKKKNAWFELEVIQGGEFEMQFKLLLRNFLQWNEALEILKKNKLCCCQL